MLVFASCHLIISSTCCPQYIWLEPILHIIPVSSGFLRVPLSLWFFDSRLLWPEILGVSEFVAVKLSLRSWNPGVTNLLLSCDPVILRPWACYSVWKWCLLWELWRCLISDPKIMWRDLWGTEGVSGDWCPREPGAGTYRKGLVPLVRQVFCSPAAGSVLRDWTETDVVFHSPVIQRWRR